MNDDGPDNHTLTLESFKIEGRSTPNGLEEAEEKLYEAVQYPWRKCQLPSGLPAGRTASNIVRADFLRFLVLEGDGRSFVHEKGVHLDGAFIEGNLDFHGCEIKRPLFLTNCRFSGGLILEDALTCTVKLDGSVIPHIGAQRAKIRGGLYLQHCKLLGQVRLIDAEIAGSVFLRQHCHVKGEVSFRGAIIRGNLTCGSGRLSQPDGVCPCERSYGAGRSCPIS